MEARYEIDFAIFLYDGYLFASFRHRCRRV